MHLPRLAHSAADGAVHLLGPFVIPGLAAERLVRVHVPEDEAPPGRKRPALFAFDGQNLFDDAPSYAGGWNLHKLTRALGTRDRPAPVIVGIDHGATHRIDELSPFFTPQSKGQLAALARWIAERLAPVVTEQLGLDPDPRSRIIGGSSMGGLAALWTHLRHPDRFGAALCMSPSFWLGDGAIFEAVKQAPRPAASRIYLDGGGREGRLLEHVQKMYGLLSERGWPGAELRLKVDKDAGHDEKSWARRTPSALRFLLGARRRTRVAR